MSTEIEAKFLVPEPGTADRIRALTRLGSYALLEGREQSVTDDYFDTEDRALFAAGYACRRREMQDGILLTVKSVAGSDGAVHRREELEVKVPLPGLAAVTSPFVPSGWPPSPAREKLVELVGDRPLRMLFSLRQVRFVREVRDADRLVAAASLDEVSLVVGRASQRWRELEVELAGAGTEVDLAAIAGWVRATLGLNPASVSKFEHARGIVLAMERGGPLSSRRRGAPSGESSILLDGPEDGSLELPLDTLAGMGYTARLRKKTEDRLTFFDTHDGAFMKKGFAVTRSESSGLWRLREDGDVVAEEAGAPSSVPLEGPIGSALGTIPADHPTIPILDAELVQSDFGIAGVGSDPVRVRVRRWTVRSPLQPVPPATLLRISASGPDITLAYFASLLERLGFRPSREPLLEKSLSLLGVSAPGAGVPGPLRVGEADSVAEACRKIFAGEAWRMGMNARGAIRDLHPEFVHDLRVATRRARSACRLFGSILAPAELQALREELRWIAGLLGAVRDLDVLAARLDTQLKLTGSPAGFSGQVREGLRARRSRALAELVPALESGRFSALRQMLDAPRDTDFIGGDPPAGGFARRRIDKVFRKLSPWIDRPADGLSDPELHRLRILFKRLRYTCEFFRPLLGAEAESLINSFVAFQDCLGLHQDATTAIRILGEMLAEVPLAERTEEMLLSMGSLLQIQRDIQKAQRDKFTRRWESAPEMLAAWRRTDGAASSW
jgi:inorganic triphosphatase YgiF